MGAKPALPNPLGGGHAGFEKRPATGPRRTAARSGGGRTLVATSLLAGRHEKAACPPTQWWPQGQAVGRGSAHEPPQGGAVAESLLRREVQARQGVLRSKTTQGAQALRRTGVGSAGGFAC